MEIDFVGGKANYRRQHGGKELLLKALGKSKTPYEIIDATAGLGRDAFVLASAKHRVILLERSPTIAKLLADALQRAKTHPELSDIINRMVLIAVDAKDFLANCTTEHVYPDIIYLDPMFPERRKTALVKKDMRFLQTVVGDDSDASQLLDRALACARKRIIVKRPLHAPTLTTRKPDLCYKGKSCRFDVYLAKIG